MKRPISLKNAYEKCHTFPNISGEEMRASRRNLASTLILQGITNSDIHVYRCVLVNECTGFTKVATVDLQAKVLPCSGNYHITNYRNVW